MISTLSGSLSLLVSHRAVSLGPCFLFSILMIFLVASLFRTLFFLPMTLKFLRLFHPSLIVQIFSLTSTFFVCGALKTASLNFNAQKCLYLCFHTCSSPISSSYFLGNSALHQTTTCRDLGIIFSEDLSWSEHYKLMLQRAYGHL